MADQTTTRTQPDPAPPASTQPDRRRGKTRVERLSDDARIRDFAAAAAKDVVDGWKQAAKDAAVAQGRRARTVAVRNARQGWLESERHRPSMFAALALLLFGLWRAATDRGDAALLGLQVATLGALAVYGVAYVVQARRVTRAGDGDELAVRRRGARIRDTSRQFAAAALAYGGWLMLCAAVGVRASTRAQTVGLAIELLSFCLLTWLVCRRHWAHLWAERRRLADLAAQKTTSTTSLADRQPPDFTQPPPGRPEPPPAPEPAAASDRHPPLPPPALLRPPAETPLGTLGGEHLEALRGVFDQFKLSATIDSWRRGPTVTRYEVELGPGVDVNRVLRLERNFAYATGNEHVRLYCPIPGRSLVGIEIPNDIPDFVHLADVLRSTAATSNPSPLLVGLGKDIDGDYVVCDLKKCVHLLAAGATGGGKSSMLHTAICSILLRATPEQVRLLLIDTKRVELTVYDGIPHLVMPVVRDAEEAIGALDWVVGEVQRRYQRLEAAGVRNIDAFNVKALAAGEPIMAYLLVVVDEWADLAMVSEQIAKRNRKLDIDVEGGNAEDAVVRITQLARASGVHLLLATQRPDADVVTGLIKVNIPSRLAFSVPDVNNSRIILDKPGAEALIGRGDSLFHPYGEKTPRRVQCAYLTEPEVEAIVAHLKGQGDPAYLVDPADLATYRPAAPRAVADVVLAIITRNPGCTKKFIEDHPVWQQPGGKPPSKSTLSREFSALEKTGLLTREREGREWVNHQVTSTGRERADAAAAVLFPAVTPAGE